MKYKEIASTKIAENRTVILSKIEDQTDTYTMAQVLEVNEPDTGGLMTGKTFLVYMKGAMHINGISALYNLRDMLNLAISEIEKEANEEAQEWD